jgi:phosphatidylglycerophosphatase A
MRFDLILKYVATLGFVGYIPFAPGTFGSVFSLIIFILLKPSNPALILILLFTIPLGAVSSHFAEKLLHEKDSSHVVIDEFCGYLLSMLFIPFSITNALAAFFLFRVFDILKPFPIRKIETALKGGYGIMADDLMAALYTNLIMQIWVIAH